MYGPLSSPCFAPKAIGGIAVKVIVYLCEKHAKELDPKLPMTDDIVICQVPVCFQLATWKYFTDIPKKHAPRNADAEQTVPK